MPEWDIEGTKAAYEELCRSHDRIADFRAKLLALLPIASGTGIFLLLNLNGVEAEQYLLLNIGIFGCLITFGLFLYELRGIQRCKGLSHCGKELEKKLLGENSHVGTFSGEPNPAFG